MLFSGWEVRIVKNCDRGHSFSLYGTDPKPANNMFIFFFFPAVKLVLQITNGFVYANFVIESTSAPSTNDL